MDDVFEETTGLVGASSAFRNMAPHGLEYMAAATEDGADDAIVDIDEVDGDGAIDMVSVRLTPCLVWCACIWC